jgi:two-component system response regulator HydG
VNVESANGKRTMPAVLIIDDEETILATWMEILRREGLFVGSASSIKETTRKFQEREWDVIITDLRLVDEDGVSILSEIQRRAPTTISIVLTGFPTLESAVSAIRAGVHDYLIKPCKVEDMLTSIRRGLAKREAILRDAIMKRHSLKEFKRLTRENVKLQSELRRLQRPR